MLLFHHKIKKSYKHLTNFISQQSRKTEPKKEKLAPGLCYQDGVIMKFDHVWMEVLTLLGYEA